MLYFSETPILTATENERLAEAVDQYVTKIVMMCDTKLQKVRMAHNLLQTNMIYPRQVLHKDGAIQIPVLPDTAEGQHYISAYGALVNKRANSYGISRAMALLLKDKRINIPCQFLEGCVVHPIRGAVIHLWNVVEINHRHYHVDTTIDIIENKQTVIRTGEAGRPLSDLDHNELPMVEILMPSYEHCLVSDESMRALHVWDPADAPRCMSSYTIVR